MPTRFPDRRPPQSGFNNWMVAGMALGFAAMLLFLAWAATAADIATKGPAEGGSIGIRIRAPLTPVISQSSPIRLKLCMIAHEPADCVLPNGGLASSMSGVRLVGNRTRAPIS
jgi:hypothetical protein